MKPERLPDRFRIDSPKRFQLADFDPTETAGFKKGAAEEIVAEAAGRLNELQERLYANHTWAVLVVLQGVDAAGKDSVIKRVMGAFNPQGCMVHPFKAPTTEELDHEFLWRANSRLPRRGNVGVFNRSHYEEVLVVRVHHELLAKQGLPPELVTRRIWQERFEDINAWERHLVRNGTLVVKFHLRVSEEEQKRRLLERIDDPAKRWKFSAQDVAERKLWNRTMRAYEDMIGHTSTPEAPWYVVPADKKWFARLVVAAVLVEKLAGLDLKLPEIDAEGLQELKRIRKALEAE